MKFYDQAKPGRTLVVRLNPGDYVMESLRQVIREACLKDGYIASGVASFDHCRLKTAVSVSQPPVFVYPEWNDVPRGNSRFYCRGTTSCSCGCFR